MKVELISKNKVKITITSDELKKRKLSLDDIQKNANIIAELIDELELDENFSIDDSSNLIIEANLDKNNSIIVTITKIDEMSELKKYSLLETTKKRKSTIKKNNDIYYKVNSNIYYFDSLDSIFEMCSNTKQEKLFFGKNSLYQYNEHSYFLIFSNSSTKNQKFLKTFVILSEYCRKYYSLDMISTAIKEKSKLIIENNALQTLSKI